MRLKIHEGTVKMMSKLKIGETMKAVDDLGYKLDVIKRGPFVVIDIEEPEPYWV